MKIEKFVARWKKEGVVDSVTASRIVDFEKNRCKFSFGNMLIKLAGLAIFLGIAAIIGSNWDHIPAGVKMGVHAALNCGIAYALFRFIKSGREKTVFYDLLIALLAGLTLTFIALVGQIYQTQEPTWKALALWLALASPFWLVLGESKKIVRLWILSFLAFFAYFIFDGPLADLQTRAYVGVLLPFVLIAIGQIPRFRKRRDVTFLEISFAGFAYIAVAASAAQFVWRLGGWHVGEMITRPELMICWNTTLAAFVATVLIIFARYYNGLIKKPTAVDVFLVLSVIVAAAPFLIAHESMPVVGAVVVMAYWALCGWVGVKGGYPRALSLASTLIALRLIAVYIEVFGSLLKTGVGLVISGVLLMALVWGTRRINAHLGVKS